jgi:hypothetical protein
VAQSYKLTYNGRTLWTNGGKQRAARGLQLALELILQESDKLTPLDEGTLVRSGTTSIDPATLSGAVSYNTPYAVRQHEELTWRHASGRQAKFLETAVNANRDTAAQVISAEIRKWFA